MIYERSYGAVVYRKDKHANMYLLLLYERDGKQYWDFPKGGAEAGEDAFDAMRAEVKEETGITQLDMASGFKEKTHYMFRNAGELVSKDVVFFLARTEQEKVTVSFEHKDADWYTYEEAMKIMKFKDSKDVLTKAHEFLGSGKAVFQKRLV